jgi:hypothetical protein
MTAKKPRTAKAKADKAPAAAPVPQEGAPAPETVADSLNAAIVNAGSEPPSTPEPPPAV